MTRVLDIRANIHATYHREIFTNYTPFDFGVVKMENIDRAQITGRGNVPLETDNGTRLVLKLVSHVGTL